MVVTACANALQYVGLPEAKYHLRRAADGPFWRLPAAYHRAQRSYAAAAKTAPPRRRRFEGQWVAQQYLPDIHKGRRFYNPSDQGCEANVKARVETWRAGREGYSAEGS